MEKPLASNTYMCLLTFTFRVSPGARRLPHTERSTHGQAHEDVDNGFRHNSQRSVSQKFKRTLYSSHCSTPMSHGPFRIIISTFSPSGVDDVYVGEKPDRLKALLPSGVTVSATDSGKTP